MVREDECHPLESNNPCTAYHFTCTGAGHRKTNTVCQDASGSVSTALYSLAVVCDGHGGADYFRSDRGSRMAVAAFHTCVADTAFVQCLDEASSAAELPPLLNQLVKSLILHWNTAVENDLAEHPITEEELSGVSPKAKNRYQAGERLHAIYGTTLIGLVCGRRWCFGIQIGDGKCVAVNRAGQMYQPIPWDEACFLNVTTSLSDENAYEEFRCWYAYFADRDFPVAVFLGSDGVDDCFAGDENLHDFYRLILKHLADTKTEQPVTDLEEYLPTLSDQGSKDDISLAMLLYRDQINHDTRRWEGTGRRIYIDNFGDMDQDSCERTYRHQTVIPAQIGSYDVPIGRYGTREVEVLFADDTAVHIQYGGEEHILTRTQELRFVKSEYQASYDGAWHTTEDDTTFTLL